MGDETGESKVKCKSGRTWFDLSEGCTKKEFDSYLKIQNSLEKLSEKWAEIELKFRNGDKTAFEDYKKELGEFTRLNYLLKNQYWVLRWVLHFNEFLSEIAEYHLEDRLSIVRTGDYGLDELLPEGIPFGSSVSLYGHNLPEKDIIMSGFVADTLSKRRYAVCVLTDMSVKGFRNDLKNRFIPIERYEKEGLIHYVDAYSNSLNFMHYMESYSKYVIFKEKNPYVSLVKGPGDIKNVLSEIDNFSKKIEEDEEGRYRLIFSNLSPVVSALGANKTYDNLINFVEKRREAPDASLYFLEKDKHCDKDVQKILSMMDGTIEFKRGFLVPHFKINGLKNAATYKWAPIVPNKHGVNDRSLNLIKDAFSHYLI